MDQQPPDRQQPFEQQRVQQVPFPPQQSGHFQPQSYTPSQPQLQQQISVADETTQPAIDRIKPNRTRGGRKRSVAVVLLLASIVLLIGGTLGYLFIQRGNSEHQSASPTVYPMNEVPTPSSSRTTYTNTKYGYSFVYPSEWKLSTYEFQGINHVQASYQVIAGDAYPFEVDCYANPKELDAQTLWKQENANNSGETPIGYITLKSGIVAFLAVGHGQVLDNDYILVHKQIACDFNQFGSDRANTPITEAVLNSFQWK